MITRRKLLQAALVAPGVPVCALADNNSVNFAVIGDYGKYTNPAAWAVAKLVGAWAPDYIVTCGDNSYGMLDGRTFAQNNEMYQAYIPNRFFPCLGNHDKDIDDGQLYSNFFSCARYYAKTIGDVLLVSVDSTNFDSAQAAWAESTLKESTTRWKIVFFHHPPYTSSASGGSSGMRRPWHSWGADVVLCGHNHIYERIEHPDGLYIINGLGGKSLYPIEGKTPYTKASYNANYGAMRVTGGRAELRLEFINLAGQLIDSASLSKPLPANMTPIIQLLLG